MIGNAAVNHDNLKIVFADCKIEGALSPQGKKLFWECLNQIKVRNSSNAVIYLGDNDLDDKSYDLSFGLIDELLAVKLCKISKTDYFLVKLFSLGYICHKDGKVYLIMRCTEFANNLFVDKKFVKFIKQQLDIDNL